MLGRYWPEVTVTKLVRVTAEVKTVVVRDGIMDEGGRVERSGEERDAESEEEEVSVKVCIQ